MERLMIFAEDGTEIELIESEDDIQTHRIECAAHEGYWLWGGSLGDLVNEGREHAQAKHRKDS